MVGIAAVAPGIPAGDGTPAWDSVGAFAAITAVEDADVPSQLAGTAGALISIMICSASFLS